MSKKIADIDCEDVMNNLMEFLDNEVAEKKSEEIHQHIHKCRSCFSRVEFERRLGDAVSKVDDLAASDDLQDRIKNMMDKF